MKDIATWTSVREQLAAKPVPADYPHCCAWHETHTHEDYRGFACR